jgi:hypothetical protein
MRYQPDLALRRGDELVLIEVVSAKSGKEKQAAIEYLVVVRRNSEQILNSRA